MTGGFLYSFATEKQFPRIVGNCVGITDRLTGYWQRTECLKTYGLLPAGMGSSGVKNEISRLKYYTPPGKD